MADTKLSALTELAATPANDDEIYIRDVSEAAAQESKRITISNLITFETLDANSDVGTGAAQVAAGDHTHTLIVTEAFWDGSTKVTGTTSWVEVASISIPANALEVMAWCYGSSDTSIKSGYCRLLYNGVEILQSSNANYAISPVPWQGDGLGSVANLTVEIKKHVDAAKIIYGYGAWYITI